MKQRQKSTNITFPSYLSKKLLPLAQREHRSISAQVAWVVEHWLDNQEKKEGKVKK